MQPKRASHAGRLDVGNAEILANLRRLSEPLPDNRGRADILMIPRRANKILNSAGRSINALVGAGHNPAFMHPKDMACFGIANGDHIEISSASGRVTAIAATEPGVRRGCLSITHGFGLNPNEEEDPETDSCNVGRLLSADTEFDPITGIPRMGAMPVRIMRVTE